MHGRIGLLAILGLALAAMPGLAQQPRAPSAPAAPADSPDRTTAVFGDWSVQCFMRPQGTPARACEMLQTTQDGRGQTVAALGITRTARGDPLRMVAIVPVNLQPQQPARLALGGQGRQEAAVSLAFKHCLPRGCTAEAELREEALLRRLKTRAADQPGRLEWRDAAGGEQGVPVSFRGFAAALEALERESGS